MVLLLLAPLLLAIALAVKLTSRGPVVARQEKIGLDGRPFSLLTFRIMAQDQRPRRNRVTRVGRVLHRYSLNVLPQLVNVLKGEMTLVGPRPLWPDEIDLVDPGMARAWIQARPGLTRPRTGRRGARRGAIPWRARRDVDDRGGEAAMTSSQPPSPH